MRSAAAALLLLAMACSGQTAGVRVWRDSITLPTYRETEPKPDPPFDQLPNGPFVYPYTVRVGFTNDKSNQTWRTLNLENEYLSCRVLPDLGGHLYNCRDKRNNVEMFYANSSIRKSHVGPRGAWVALGIEPNFPVAHSLVAVSPVRHAIVQNPDGSGTAWVGTIDRVTDMEWRVAYTLYPGRAVLEQKVWMYNRGNLRRPFQWWSNAAIPLREGGLQFIFPTYTISDHGTGQLDAWPKNRAGLDQSLSENHTAPMGVFAHGSREPFFGAYHAKSRTGIVHVADPKGVPGKKLWLWGKRSDANVRNTLSDDGSTYAELQAGVLAHQDQMAFLGPQQVRSFTEYWIPSLDTGGITRATESAVLFMSRQQDAGGQVKLTIEVNVTEAVPGATVRLLDPTGKVVITRKVDLNPATGWRFETDAVPSQPAYIFTVTDRWGKVLLLHNEGRYDAVRTNEAALGVRRRDLPDRRESEHDYLKVGQHNESHFYRDWARGEYNKAVEKHPQSVESRKAAARMALLLNRFEEASRILTAGGQPTDLDLIYLLGIAKAALGDENAAQSAWNAAMDHPLYGAAARVEAAGLLARQGKLAEAAEFLSAVTAAVTNAHTRPIALRAALLRKMGNRELAAAEVESALKVNPLDAFARVESVTLRGGGDELWAHLAGDAEWVLDVAEDYLHLGMYEDAVALLGRTYPDLPAAQSEPGLAPPQNYPLVAYYRGYARKLMGQSPAADWAEAARQSVSYVFPSRPSSFPVLRAAIEANPKDAVAHYLLGCLYWHSRMEREAADEWSAARSLGFKFPGKVPEPREVISRATPSPSPLKPSAAPTPAASSPPAKPVTVPSAFANSEAVAAAALNFLAEGNIGAAVGLFTEKNLPQERQSDPVREAYVEVQLQRVLAVAASGNCEPALLMVERFGDEDTRLPFTLYGFGKIIGSPRVQFYLGLAEASCGDSKAAKKRWGKLAKAKPDVTSIDFAFPVIAAVMLDPEGARERIETALQSARGGTDPARLFSEGLLLRVSGQRDEAAARFAKARDSAEGWMRYLAASALRDPGLPK